MDLPVVNHDRHGTKETNPQEVPLKDQPHGLYLASYLDLGSDCRYPELLEPIMESGLRR
jgi:hypothetical protein